MEALITLLPGDGIGPEVMDEVKRIIDEMTEILRHDAPWAWGWASVCRKWCPTW